MKKIVLFFLLLSHAVAFSQEIDKNDFRDVKSNKGKMFFYWGWNRGHFSKSDIRFKGTDYDFTLSDVRSKDKPKPFGIYYFKPDEITIPQTNFRLGYFIRENYTISLGVDHMKYVMTNNQTVKINGDINIGSDFDGNYSDRKSVV